MYYVITVKGRRRRQCIDDPWEEYYYNCDQSYWCKNFYLATFFTDLEVAKNHLSELEYKDNEDYEYNKDSVAVKRVVICYAESGEAPKAEDSAVCGYVLSVVSTTDKLRHYFSMGGGWTRFIESALIFPAVELVEEEINENEEIFCERDRFDLGTLAIEGLTVSPVKKVDFFGMKWRWEPVSNANYRCPECRRLVEFPKDTVRLYDYCPNCGRKMIKEEESR